MNKSNEEHRFYRILGQAGTYDAFCRHGKYVTYAACPDFFAV